MAIYYIYTSSIITRLEIIGTLFNVLSSAVSYHIFKFYCPLRKKY